MRRAAAVVGALLAAATAGVHAESRSATRAGDVLSLALPAGVAAAQWWNGDVDGLGQFAAAFAVGVGAVEALNHSTGVERPDGSNDRSFPSGHAARAFSAATAVHRREGLHVAWPLYVAATYVGWTRVQADRHHWADVVGAAAVTAVATRWLVSERGAVLVSAAPDRIRVEWRIALR